MVVEADRLYLLDPERAVATPLRFLGAGEVVGLATCGRRPLALCSDDGGLRLLIKVGGRWKNLGPPLNLRLSATPPLLCADESSAVLLGESQLLCRTRGLTRRQTVESLPEDFFLSFPWSRAPHHALLARGRLYLGYDWGEWSGGLLALDVGTGRWQEIHLIQGGHLAVRDVRADPGGAVWVVAGVVHTFDGREWAVFGNSTGRYAARWGLPPASLDAVAFDRESRPYPPVQALLRQRAQLDLRHVQPTAVLGHVVPLDALRNAPRLPRRERLVQAHDAGPREGPASCDSTSQVIGK